MRATADSLVEKYWPAITRVARHLAARSQLSGEEIRDLVEQ
jgi:hypothetical protein